MFFFFGDFGVIFGLYFILVVFFILIGFFWKENINFKVVS